MTAEEGQRDQRGDFPLRGGMFVSGWIVVVVGGQCKVTVYWQCCCIRGVSSVSLYPWPTRTDGFLSIVSEKKTNKQKKLLFAALYGRGTQVHAS